MAKVIKKETGIDYAKSVKEYDTLRSQKKIIEDRMKQLGEEIKNHAEAKGVKDNNGSFYLNCDNFQIGKQAKKSISFTDEALKFLKLKKFTSAIDVIEKVNEKEFENLIAQGKVTLEDLENITSTKISYSVVVKKLDEMPVIEETTVNKPMAASTKPKSKIKAKK